MTAIELTASDMIVISETTSNDTVRRTAMEAAELLTSGIDADDIIVITDDRWSNFEIAMSRDDIESDDTWPDWKAPRNAEDIGMLLADWVQYNADHRN